MENDHFERQIKAKLDCWEVDPPADMWNRIQKELPTANTPSKQAIIYRYAFWGAAAAIGGSYSRVNKNIYTKQSDPCSSLFDNK